jgi:hypothetical protein
VYKVSKCESKEYTLKKQSLKILITADVSLGECYLYDFKFFKVHRNENGVIIGIEESGKTIDSQVEYEYFYFPKEGADEY